MAMRFHYFGDEIRRKQLTLLWAPGATNLMDHCAKHHSATNHKKVMSIHMSEVNSSAEMQECVEQLALLASHHGRTTQTFQLAKHALHTSH